MLYEDFKKEIEQVIKNRPCCYRKGQAVFNYIDEKYGVARTVQFYYNIDCFYKDDNIDDFIECSWKLINDLDI